MKTTRQRDTAKRQRAPSNVADDMEITTHPGEGPARHFGSPPAVYVTVKSVRVGMYRDADGGLLLSLLGADFEETTDAQLDALERAIPEARRRLAALPDPSPATNGQRTPTEATRAALPVRVLVSSADDVNDPHASVTIPIGDGKDFEISMSREPIPTGEADPREFHLIFGDAYGSDFSRSEVDAFAAALPPIAQLRDALLKDYEARTCSKCGTYQTDE